MATGLFARTRGALRGAFGQQHEEGVWGILFILPSLVLLLSFVFLPAFYAIYISLLDWDMISPSPTYVGLQNYREVVSSARFWRALGNTTSYVAGAVPLGVVVPLLLAWLMTGKRKGRDTFRAIYFLPTITSAVAVALVWSWLYQPQLGLFNFLLSKLGLPRQGWLTDPNLAMASIVIMAVWQGAGSTMVLLLAGLSGIPADYYEAATIDGASRARQMRHITVPLLRPILTFVIITGIIGGLQVFTAPYVLTQGGPMGATETVVYYIYNFAFYYRKPGYATAMSYVLFAVILAFTLLQRRQILHFTQFA